jgi:DNA processing protein
MVAIIGTRDPDPLGVALASRIAADLAERGVSVISGGALGIDAGAHRGALLADGRTVVVMPAGLEHWYPRRHAALYRDVLSRGGALVSPFHPRTPPASWTFPRRNELLAAMADVVVVVQAPAASGALVCAEAALRLGRRVLAVPGSTADRRAQGCNRLLRAGARACVDDAPRQRP